MQWLGSDPKLEIATTKKREKPSTIPNNEDE